MRGIERGRRAAKNAPIHPEHVSRRDTDTSLVLFTVSAAPLCLFLTEIKLTATHCPNNNKKGTWPSQLLAKRQIQNFFFVQRIRIRRETISKWIAFYLERENQGKSLRLYYLRVFFYSSFVGISHYLGSSLSALSIIRPSCRIPFLRRGIVCRSLRVVPVTLRPVTGIVSLS